MIANQFMRTGFILIIFFLSARYSLQSENLLIDHVEESLGISLKIPYAWNEKAFIRGKTKFFPTPTLGSFLMVNLMEPQDDNYSTVDLEFALHDLMQLSIEDQKIKDFEFHKTTLSGLPAYDVTYTIEKEKRFRIRMFFTSANEKIYMIQYQSLEENFDEYEKYFVEKIVPSFKIQVITQPELRYQSYELPEFGFSFYCPASWRIVQTDYSRSPMPIYTDLNTGTQHYYSSSSGEEIRREIRKNVHTEGVFIGSQDPVLIVVDPKSYLIITVIGLSYRYEAADAIEGYFKGFRNKAKKLEGFRHLREFPIEIDGNLTMEYAYSYKEKEDGEEKVYYVTNYISYANERLYHIRFAAPDENYSRHIKEVERLVKYFKFISVKT
jgi:hypothetical protein